jgi:hypothetical protein
MEMGYENPNSDSDVVPTEKHQKPGISPGLMPEPMGCYDVPAISDPAQASGKRDSSEWSGRTKRPFMLKTWLKPRMNKPWFSNKM